MKLKAKLFFLALGVGISVALVVTVFMQLLYRAGELFTNNWSGLIMFLPLWGLATYFIQRLKIFKNLATSENIIEEVISPRQPISHLLAPFIMIMTCLSHLFGACVGRESAAVQIGASVAESVSPLLKRFFRIPENRSLILRMGLAAGFSAGFAAPLAGFIFALEHPQHFTWKMIRSSIWVLLASITAYGVSLLFGDHHAVWPVLEVHFFAVVPSQLFAASIFLGLLAIFYEQAFKFLQYNTRNWPAGISLFSAGALITLMTFSSGAPLFNGLGSQLTARAFAEDIPFHFPALKTIFLLISAGAGFKGGEVTPLISIAALVVAYFFSSPVLVAAGLSSLFAYRLRSPLAGVVILFEFFNWKIAVLGLAPILTTWIFHELYRRYLDKGSTLKAYF